MILGPPPLPLTPHKLQDGTQCFISKNSYVGFFRECCEIVTFWRSVRKWRRFMEWYNEKRALIYVVILKTQKSTQHRKYKLSKLMPRPSARTKYFLSRTKPKLSWTKLFCTWQNILSVTKKSISALEMFLKMTFLE